MSKRKDDEEQLSFSLFPDEEKKEKVKNVYNSEEDALDEIMEQHSAESEAAQTWPVLDPGDIPGAVVPPPAQSKKKKSLILNTKLLRRAALAFLAGRKPDGVASNVYLPAIHAPADAVSFMLSGSAVSATAIALAALSPERLAMSVNKKKRLEDELSRQLARKEELEARIRETEPHLNSSLFADAAVWEYEKSRNAGYHHCLRRIEKLRHELQYSGKLERLAAEKTGDELFLVLPDGADFSCVPAEWGVVAVSPENLAVREVRTAVRLDAECSAKEAMVRMAAAAVRSNVLFAEGIQLCKDGRAVLAPLPRKRAPYFMN